MKLLCLWGSIACMLFANNADCQSAPPLNQHPIEKALIFNQLPEKISIPVAALEYIFSASLNSPINVLVGPQIKLEGLVLAKVAVSADQLSINIRCNNFKNALLNISRLTKNDGSYSYVGRIISPQHGDVLLLWEENGQYSFIKQKQLLAMVE